MKGSRRSSAIGFGLGLAVLLAQGGCVSAKYVPTGGVYPPRAPDCPIEIYTTGVPDRPYEEIGR